MGIDTYFDGQLMYASLKITYKNKTKVIDKLVVDTGAAKTFISVDAIQDIELYYDDEDIITTVFGVGGPDNSFQKTIDNIAFGSNNFKEYTIDFGAFQGEYDINGLIGLDLLREAKLLIDLDNMTITEVK